MTVRKGEMSQGHGGGNQTGYVYTSTQQNQHQETKLFHQDYHLHHRSPTGWQHQRPPPPNYSSSCSVSPPPSQVLTLTPNDRAGSSCSGCMCSTCSSYNNSRQQQYHSASVPPPPTLPHHSTQQPTWTQHSMHSFPSPVGSSSTSHDYYNSPNASYPPLLSGMSPPHQRNENETSMTAQTRFTPLQEPKQEPIPDDPRDWSASDVIRWVQWAGGAFKIRNFHAERFQMNGKALCLMDLSMFLYRVPDGGERLYQDFQARLQRALSQEKSR